MASNALLARLEAPSLAFSAAPTSSAPIDLVHLARQTMGDRVLETELLDLFARQARQIVERLRSSAPSAESFWRADLAHTLKGSARTVGAFAVADAAQNYEENARAGKLEPTDTEALAAAVDDARAALEALVG